MPLFYYKVGKDDGSIVSKEVEADNADVLRRDLEEAGFVILELRKRHAFSFNITLPGIKRGQSAENFLIFNQELLALINAGLPILQSLDLLMERTPSEAFKDALIDIKSEIRGGRALSDAMSGHTEFFPELYCNSLRAGERTGNLGEVIGRYIVYLKRVLDVKRKLIGAVTLPLFLIVIMILVISFLLAYVIPVFSEIYSDFKGDLPLPTLMLINATKFIKSYFLVFAAFLVLMAFVFRAWYRSLKGRQLADLIILKLPLIGSIITGYYISSISRTLSTVLAGGIPMLEALEMVARSATNRNFSDRLKHVQSRVREGASLADAIDETSLMTPMTVRMVEVGEATGALETMLDNISSFYEDEVNLKLQRVTNLLEPVIMVVVGVFVGAIVIVMYLPIFQMAGAVQ